MLVHSIMCIDSFRRVFNTLRRCGCGVGKKNVRTDGMAIEPLLVNQKLHHAMFVVRFLSIKEINIQFCL